MGGAEQKGRKSGHCQWRLTAKKEHEMGRKHNMGENQVGGRIGKANRNDTGSTAKRINQGRGVEIVGTKMTENDGRKNTSGKIMIW